MRKLFLALIISVMFLMPVYSGVYEDALSKNDKVFVYFYIPNCRTCKVFDKIFDNLKSNTKDYEFVRIDANTSYGSNLIDKYRGRYVPYIILTNSKTKKSVNVNHSCVMDEVCMYRAMKNFKG